MRFAKMIVIAGIAASTLHPQVLPTGSTRSTLRTSMEQALLGPFEPLAGLTESIVTNRPFSATITAEIVQTPANGRQVQRQSTYRVARDGAGRVRQENVETGRTVLFDPVERVRYILNPRTHTALRTPLGDIGQRFVPGLRQAWRTSGRPSRLANFPRTREEVMRAPNTEDLGTQIIGDIVARGERTTTNILDGAAGTAPLQIVDERWYSRDLRVAVMTRHSDPRTGESTVRCIDVRNGPPPPALFRVPTGYEVK
jgi:hypothetical protein